MVTKKKKPSQGIAIVAFILNLLVLPGLGSIIGGRKTEGVLQLVLFIISIPLIFVVIGIPLMIAMWIWALVTSIQIIKEAG